MFSPDNDAHNAVLLSLAAFLLSVPAFFISLWAVAISRTVARRTTEPILTPLIVSPAYGGQVVLQNTGIVTTTGIFVELIERRKRSSARLRVNESLKADECDTVLALDFLDELNAEFSDQHPFGDATTDILNINRCLNDQPPESYPQDQMAFHLMTRRGGQRIIISCTIPDKPRQYRIYKVRDLDSGNPEFQMCSSFLARFRVAYLRFRYKKNVLLKPIPEMPEFLREDNAE